MDPLGLKPQGNRDDAVAIVRTLRENGQVAYFAGGCVRDMLLGLEPKDFDVATDAPPARVRELFKKTQAVGQAFGVILVRLKKSVIEVATFRAESGYDDGRRPNEVRFTNAEEDARRRDFTINGLFFDPIDNRVIDFVNGQRDLADRVLRAIGDPGHRFAEDHLRLLRAVRFAARFNLSIEPATAAAICRDAPLLSRISPERIADELRRMLTDPTRARAYRDLWSLGLIAPALHLKQPLTIPIAEDRSLLLALPKDRSLSFGLVLSAALIDVRWHIGGAKHDILGNFAPAEIAKIVREARKSLKLSNEESDEMTRIGQFVHTLLNTREPGVALLKRSLAGEYAPQARLMLNALQSTGVATDRIDALNDLLDETAKTDYAPVPLLTGDDLIQAGFAPGPAFKKVLTTVYDAQLEDRLRTRQEALELARSLFSS